MRRSGAAGCETKWIVDGCILKEEKSEANTNTSER